MKPVIIVNFKTYEAGTGRRGLEIAKIIGKIANEEGIRIMIAVQPTDILLISGAVNIPVFSQHIDPVSYGSNTGKVTAEAVREAGAKGTLINHSENRLEVSEIEECIKNAKKNHLATVVCATDAKVAEALCVLGPDYIAVEPPELIAGDISVSKAEPALITETVDLVKKINSTIPVLVGAGVKSRGDVFSALQLGSQGVLLASGVMKNPDPEREIRDLIKGITE